jgi:hypothetical protein
VTLRNESEKAQENLKEDACFFPINRCPFSVIAFEADYVVIA